MLFFATWFREATNQNDNKPKYCKDIKTQWAYWKLIETKNYIVL